MPSGIAPATASTNVLTVHIATDKNGRRLLTRDYRDANGSDVGRRRRVEWEVWGGAGQSLESTAGGLGVDFLQNLDSRFERQLTSKIAETLVDLTGADPPGVDGSVFSADPAVTVFSASSTFFGSPLGSGSSGDGPDVVVFAEQQGYLLVGRGQLLTQVDLATWTVVETIVLDAPVLDMEHWQGNVYIALGSNAIMQRVVGCSSAGMVLENVTATSPAGAVYASAVKRGSDRIWYVDADQGGSTYNYIGYTLDRFVTLAAPFPVGDPESGVNGLGPYSSLLAVGEVDSIYTTTDQGKPVPLSRALDTLHSTLNGTVFADPGFGWNYYLSIAGLRAHTFSGIDNPVGVGERMRSFTGHNGIATAVYGARGELWVVYQTTAGALYGYRCAFGPQTGGTGQPVMFPWFYSASDTCNAIFATPTNAGNQRLYAIHASGTNLYYSTVAANGMDNLASLTYATAGGTAYLTTLDRNPNLLKTARLARLRDSNMESGDSWAVALGFDLNPNAPTSGTYVTVGTATTSGGKTLTPTNGGTDAQGNPTPTANISGRTIKPRITQAAAGATSSTAPPTLLGTLELEYDERPEQVEVITVMGTVSMAGISQNALWDYLRALVGAETNGPFRCQLPDDLPPAVAGASGGGQKYVQIASVEARKDANAQTGDLTIGLLCWPQAEALSS